VPASPVANGSKAVAKPFAVRSATISWRAADEAVAATKHLYLHGRLLSHSSLQPLAHRFGASTFTCSFCWTKNPTERASVRLMLRECIEPLPARNRLAAINPFDQDKLGLIGHGIPKAFKGGLRDKIVIIARRSASLFRSRCPVARRGP